MESRKQNENKVITIYDIAKEAGVSVATVSRVLTSNANVRPEKKEKVQHLIDKYNFKPNVMAQGLTGTRSKVIGVIAADVRNPFYSEMFVACEIAADKYGYTVMLGNSLGDVENEKLQLEKMQEQRVEAIIQIGGRVDDICSNISFVEKVNLVTNRIPMVITGRLDGTQCYQVRIDDTRSMNLIMEHLVELGHRRIAMIGGRMDILSTFEKFQRYKQLLDKYQIPFLPGLVGEEGGYDARTGYREIKAMLKRQDVPTAVIAVNDSAAAGVVRGIREAGLRIPDDISVISYDNTYITEMMIPALTSIDYNYQHFGDVLVKTAIDAIEGRMPLQIQQIEPKLVVRGSTGRVVPAEQKQKGSGEKGSGEKGPVYAVS